MCDGYMRVHTNVCVVDICVCRPVNVRWVHICACLSVCGVCICMHSCIYAGKIVETPLCLQTTGLGHSHWVLWSQVSNLFLVGQRPSLTGELFPQWTMYVPREDPPTLNHRAAGPLWGTVSQVGVLFLGLLRSTPSLWST